MNSIRRGLSMGVAIGTVVALIFVAGFGVGVLATRSDPVLGAASDPNIRELLTAYNLVTERSYYHPNRKHLIYAAISSMLEATGDPHTLFLAPTQNEQANQEINGSEFSGIGAMVIPFRGDLQVVAPLPNSPAQKAGLHAGDLVSKIDGATVAKMTGDDAVSRIHGRVGSFVVLTVIRGHSKPFTVRVRRAPIAPVTAYGKMLGHQIGYIEIISFGENTNAQVRDAWDSLRQHRARSLVLDLRDNPGGYVDAAQQVVSQFVGRGVVAYEKSGSGKLQPLAVLGGHAAINVPTAALVDGGTASAAEITAGALRDHHRAILIGTRTFGKGSMQSVYSLADGSSVRITDRLWLTPDKHSIQSVGLKPDLLVPLGVANVQDGSDPQLAVAERYLLHHQAH